MNFAIALLLLIMRPIRRDRIYRNQNTETEIAGNSREILLDSPKCTPFSVSGCGRRGCASARKTQTRADAQCHRSSSSRVI